MAIDFCPFMTVDPCCDFYPPSYVVVKKIQCSLEYGNTFKYLWNYYVLKMAITVEVVCFANGFTFYRRFLLFSLIG